jgi:anti-sigma28 factor (negative regulator of flagellin synthesis)
MNVRVNTTDVSLASQTGQAEQLKPGGPGGNGSQVFGKTSEDRLEVSAATENINSALAAQSLGHSQKIKQLGNLVAEGRYTIDSQDLSKAIVSAAIGEPAGVK